MMSENAESARQVRVKVCGFKRADDCAAAVAAGVDALGFNFARGPRKISTVVGKELIAALPPFVSSVGLFVDQPATQVCEVMRATGAQIAQLHGDEDAAAIAAVARFFPVIKAYRIRSEADLLAIPRDLPVQAVLLDAWSEDAHGGTGMSWDYRLLTTNSLPYPVILAGGLRPDNVAAAVVATRPYAVDTASGVEFAPAQKDAAMMQQFVRAVAAA